MKSAGLAVVVSMVALLLVACQPDPTATPVPSPTPTPIATPTSTAAPTPTPVPTPTPTPTPSPELIQAAVPTTKLAEMLGQAPDIGDRGGIVIFVDQRGALDAFGFQGVTSWEAFYALPEEEKVRLWFSVDRSGAGPNLISRIADYGESLEEIVGFSYFR